MQLYEQSGVSDDVDHKAEGHRGTVSKGENPVGTVWTDFLYELDRADSFAETFTDELRALLWRHPRDSARRMPGQRTIQLIL